jgi:hypothetical protein
MHLGFAQGQSFPPTIDAVPEDSRLTETFAFTPGALSVGALLGLVGFLVALGSHGGPRAVEDLYLPGGCIAGTLLFGAWEILRRLRRTAIVFWGNQIGIYRGGQLAQVAYPSQITVYQLSIINTIRELFAFGILALFALGGGAASLAGDLGMGLTFLGAGVGLGGAFVSSIYARIACRHFFVPKGDSTEQVMFTRGTLGRFGL